MTDKEEDECMNMSCNLSESFFQNLNWYQASDFLNDRSVQEHRQILGFRTAQSDLAWRFYKKQEMEKIKLRQIYEKRMSGVQVLVEKLFAENGIY